MIRRAFRPSAHTDARTHAPASPKRTTHLRDAYGSSPAGLQVLEFAGVTPLQTSAYLNAGTVGAGVLLRAASFAKQLSPRSNVVNNALRRLSAGVVLSDSVPLWRAPRLFHLVKKVCHELGNTIGMMPLRRCASESVGCWR